MSSSARAPIVCTGCNRKFAWKPELAGRKVKCKCGDVLIVRGMTHEGEQHHAAWPAARPRSAPPPADDDLGGLMALAADADRAAAAMPVEIRDVPVPAAAPAAAPAAVAKPRGQQAAGTLAQARAAKAAAAMIDPVRDLYVPVALILAGMAMYVGFYAHQYELGGSALTMVSIGLSVLTLLKTAVLVVGALLLAGPLGVGFGTVGPAVRKLAAISVFSDGATAWVDLLTAGTLGHHHGGTIGYGPIGWLASVAIYLAGMVYLFSMDVMDARFVVCCLGIGSRLLRVVLLVVLVGAIMNLSGAHTPAADAAEEVPASTIRASALSARVDDLKAGDFLIEAKKFLAQGNQAVTAKAVDGWYAAGCPKVWFEMSRRDINGRRSPRGLIVQLPDPRRLREQAYAVLKQYDAELHVGCSPAQLSDTGEGYLQVGLP